MTDLRRNLAEAADYLKSGRPDACLEVCDHLLEAFPGLTAARHLRGMAAARLGRKQQAIDDLAQVWTAQRQNGQAALGLGSLLRECERLEDAIAPLQAASKFPQFEAEARYGLARVFTRLRRSEEAMAEYQAVLARDPRHVESAANLAFLLERANRLDQAEQCADMALALQPNNFMAGLTKATLERRKGELQGARCRLETLLSGNLSALNRSIVLNQLGQALEREQQWTAAFDQYRQSNEILRAQHPLGKPGENGSYGLLTIARFQIWLAGHPPSMWSENLHSSPSDPVFLVGFPRSGTTLLDQALSAHPEVEVLEEYELFDEVRRRWVDGEGLSKLPDLDSAQIETARNVYLRAMTARRKHPLRSVVIDKLPLNLVYLFLIYRLFPRSRIIFMVRDPRDACLSCFCQVFDLQGAMPYFLDLDDTVRYYDESMRLALNSVRIIGNPIREIRYEELVSGFEAQMRSLVEFLQLRWDPSVLDYRHHSQERMIYTPSYQQVVGPLQTASIGRWRNYRERVEPAFVRLGPWVEYFDYPAN